MTSLEELYDTFFRPLNLEWKLDDASRRRILRVCALPAIVIIAQLVQAIVLYSFGEHRYLEDGLWHRVLNGTDGLLTLSPAVVGVLFFAGLRRWSRVEGNWMLLVGAILAGVAILFSLLATLVTTVIEDRDLITNLQVYLVWLAISQRFGLISIGFFFVAYRGLSQAPA